MKSNLWALLLPALALAAPAAASKNSAQQSAQVAGQSAATTAAAGAEVAASAAEPLMPCQKKKKGFGGLLRAARSSGLISVVSGRAGTGGALVNSATNTAIDVADASARMAPQAEKPTC